MLQLQGVGKSFGEGAGRTQVLKDVNLDIQEGEFVAIIGFSGSGKTTLVSLLSGLTKPDQGQALMVGQPITGPSLERGVVFQNYSLLPWLSVLANVELSVAQAFPKMPKAERKARALEFVGMVHLSHAAARRPGELSGGMRQRVSVARALAVNPQVLLMDEPLGALDALTRATLQDQIAHIWQRDRKTAMLVTNDVDEAMLLADRIIPLTPGPGATLGQSFTVDLPRPRDRTQLNSDPRFTRLRTEITACLMDLGGMREKSARALPKRPDIKPVLPRG